MTTTSETVICSYRVRPDRLDEFLELAARHWPLLHSLELVTDTPEQLFVSIGDRHVPADEPMVVSIFEWVSAEAAGRAHDHPDVAEIWEAMEPLCEERRGQPSMDFPHYRPLART